MEGQVAADSRAARGRRMVNSAEPPLTLLWKPARS